MSWRFNAKNFTKTGGKIINKTTKQGKEKPSQTKKTKANPNRTPMKQDDVMGDSWVPVLSLSLLLIRCLHSVFPLVSWTSLAGSIGVVGEGFRVSEGVVLISAADI